MVRACYICKAAAVLRVKKVLGERCKNVKTVSKISNTKKVIGMTRSWRAVTGSWHLFHTDAAERNQETLSHLG